MARLLVVSILLLCLTHVYSFSANDNDVIRGVERYETEYYNGAVVRTKYSAWKRKALVRARERLTRLQELLKSSPTSLKCRRRKARLCKAARRRLRKARKCRFKDRGFHAYRDLREKCRERKPLLRQLNVKNEECKRLPKLARIECIEKNVLPLRKKREEAFISCDAIGWNASGRKRRARCRSIRKAKEDIRKVEAIKCSGSFKSRKELRRLIEKAKRRIAFLEKGAGPSVAPRA